MANPPITIGTFDNVPAPGSPLKSDWPQEISTYVQRLGRGYVGHVQTATATTSVGATTVDITGASVAWTASPDRRYRVTLQTGRLDQFTASGNAAAQIADGANNNKIRGWAPLAAGQFGGISVVEVVSGLSGAQTRKGRVDVSAGSLTVQAGTVLIVEDIGSTTALPT